MKDTNEHLRNVLRARGYRATPGRLRLLAFLEHAERPLPVSLIYKGLNAAIDEVTLYRALEALCEAGVLNRVDMRKTGAHYEFAHSHHHHLVCKTCGVIEDVKDCPDKSLESRVLLQSKQFNSIAAHSMEFFGVCRSCA